MSHVELTMTINEDTMNPHFITPLSSIFDLFSDVDLDSERELEVEVKEEEVSTLLALTPMVIFDPEVWHRK